MLDLESHLAGLSFDDPQPFLVLADALQAEQDPWGELIALQCAGKTELAHALIEKHAFAGPLNCEWKFGFVKTVTIAPALDDTDLELAMQAFFALPVARLCDGIELVPLRTQLEPTRESEDSVTQIIRPYAHPSSLLSAIPQRVTRVSFGPWPAPPVAAYTAMPAFRELGVHLQRVTELRLVGADPEEASPLDLPNCSRLALHCGDLHEATIAALRDSNLPNLAHLTISMGGESHTVLDDIQPPNEEDGGWVYDNYDAAALDDLEIHDIIGHFNGALGILAECTFPALRTLDLSDSVLGRREIEQLAALPWLNQLKKLTLARCDLDAEKLAPIAGNSRVKTLAAEGAPAFFMRYVGTME